MPHSVTYTAQSVSQSVSHTPPQQQQQYRNTRNSNFENDTIVKEPFTLNRVATRTVDSPKQTIENDSIDLLVNFSPDKAQANPDYCPLVAFTESPLLQTLFCSIFVLPTMHLLLTCLYIVHLARM